jgi:hypothetical protein
VNTHGTSYSRTSAAITSSSARVNTLPVGLCGVLSTSALGRRASAARSRSSSSPHVPCRSFGGSSGTNTGVAPASTASGP